MISGEEKLTPGLTPARPKALPMVYISIRIGHSVTHSARLESLGTKSMYASSMSTTPRQVGCSRTCSTSDLAIRFPVEFPGVVM